MAKAVINFTGHRMVDVELDGVEFVTPFTLAHAAKLLRKELNRQKRIAVVKHVTTKAAKKKRSKKTAAEAA